jgi:hypothetical protein
MRWGEVKDHLAVVLREGRIPDDEPVVLKFPRQLAKKRIRNAEARKRVSWVATPENYSAFHAARSHILEVIGNSTLADQLMAEVLARVPDETWRALVEVGNQGR